MKATACTVLVWLLVSLVGRPYAFFTVPAPPADTLPFLIHANITWADSRGPLRETPEMTILQWTSMISWTSVIDEQRGLVVKTDHGACRFVRDKSMVESADVVWFFWPRANERPLPPIKRPTGALWVYYSGESARDQFRRDEQLVLLNDDINMLISYQSVSDITHPYGFFVPLDAHSDRAPLPNFQAKTGLALAVISNGESGIRNHRLEVIGSIIVG